MEMVSADMLAASGVRRKMKEIQSIGEDGGVSVPMSVLEVIDLSREEVRTKRVDAKLLDCTKELILELDISRISQLLACDRVQTAEACVQPSEEHVAALDVKCSKHVGKLAHVEKKRCTHVTSLATVFKV